MNALVQRISADNAAATMPKLDLMSSDEIAKLSQPELQKLLEERDKWSTERAYATQMMLHTRGQLPFQLAWGSTGVAKIINS